MPTFIPPTTIDQPLGYLDDTDDSFKLFKYFAPNPVGKTVWKDELGVWHDALYPYAGGETTRYYDDHANPKFTQSSPASGLATAQYVFLGGHEYTVTEDLAAELIAAGYGSGIDTATVSLTGTEEELAKLTHRVASPGIGEVPQAPVIDSEERFAFALDQPTPGFSSGRRDYWMVDGTGNWTDVYFEITLWPIKFGLQPGPPEYDVLPQGGVCLRRKFQSGKWRAVTINNNVFLRLPFANIGVWEMNEDGTGFANRQFSYNFFDSHALPYTLRGYLVGNIVTINSAPMNEPPNWNNPTYTKVVNLDTDAGDSVTIPTPSGAGDSEFSAGLVAAHSTANPEGFVRLWRPKFQRIT